MSFPTMLVNLLTVSGVNLNQKLLKSYNHQLITSESTVIPGFYERERT